MLPKRFAKYGLGLHPDKTRLVEFRSPSRRDGDRDSNERESFDVLGFAHYWGESRKGRWVVKRKTAKDRLKRALVAIDAWCKKWRHVPLREQHQKLRQKLLGHFGYFGITGNIEALVQLVRGTERSWRKWLERRSQRGTMTWERFKLVLKRYPLPPPRIVHSALAR